MGGAAGGAAAGGAAGGGASGGAAGGAAGGAIGPLLFGAQRFTLTANLGGEVQRGVAGSMGWIGGEAPITSLLGIAEASPNNTDEARRRLLRRFLTGADGGGSEDDGSAAAPVEVPAEWIALLNVQMTFGIGIGLVILLQITLVCLWRHVVNRSWYRARRQVHPSGGDVGGGGIGMLLVPICCWPLCLVRTEPKPPKPPKFTPFPKSLMWPTPLFFTCAIFVTGLTKAAVKLLAVRPADCSPHCEVSAIATLLAIGLLLLFIVVDLALLFYGMRGQVSWKAASKAKTVNEVGDPIMRFAARTRVQLATFGLAARQSVGLCHVNSCSSSAGEAPRTPRSLYKVAHCADSASVSSKAVGVEVPSHGLHRPFTLRDARERAEATLAVRGLRDRKSGGFGLPEEDTAEPERTERILRHPFVFCRERAGDAFQAREGFLLFRVNGSSRIATCYRVIVVFVNVALGVLSGLQPLLPPGSWASIAQAAVVLALQLFMAFICCKFLPDADRIISRVAGTQFMSESLSTAALLGAALITALGATTSDEAGGGADWPSGGVGAGEDEEAPPTESFGAKGVLVTLGFWAALVAMAMPAMQLLEQRCFTPSVMLVRNKTGDKLALGAALYMLAMNLPRQMFRLKDALAALGADGDGDDGDDGGDAGGGGADASADAGDDEGGAAAGDGAGAGEMVRQAGAGASKLLARAAAAKEVQSKDLAVGDGGGRSSAATLQKDDDMTFEDVADGDGDDAGVGIDD